MRTTTPHIHDDRNKHDNNDSADHDNNDSIDHDNDDFLHPMLTSNPANNVLGGHNIPQERPKHELL